MIPRMSAIVDFLLCAPTARHFVTTVMAMLDRFPSRLLSDLLSHRQKMNLFELAKARVDSYALGLSLR
jgi:hypothetical protein